MKLKMILHKEIQDKPLNSNHPFFKTDRNLELAPPNIVS